VLKLFLTPQLQQGTEMADILFQQGEAPLYYQCMVMCFLVPTSPTSLLARSGIIGCPSRSPDLTPIGFHFWSYVNDKIVVSSLSKSLRILQGGIYEAAMSVDEDVLWRREGIHMGSLPSPLEATWRTYEQKLKRWAIVV
jgi:hypothetical protein